MRNNDILQRPSAVSVESYSRQRKGADTFRFNIGDIVSMHASKPRNSNILLASDWNIIRKHVGSTMLEISFICTC